MISDDAKAIISLPDSEPLNFQQMASVVKEYIRIKKGVSVKIADPALAPIGFRNILIPSETAKLASAFTVAKCELIKILNS